jgi:integrase/recombinase XerD
MSEILDFSKITFRNETHRNQKVILCFFDYDPALVALFRKNFPNAKWSRSYTSWYVPDNTGYRNRLGLQNPEIGASFLPKMFAQNQQEFIAFRNALTQKAFSKATIKTYLSEFAQLLILLKQHPVNELTKKKLNAYFLYCIKKLKHSENQVYSRMNAIKSYFKLVLNREEIFDQVIKPKATKSLPKVLSKEEVKKLFVTTTNLKHLLVLKMAYGMGLRVSELIALKYRNIDFDRDQVHIEAAKGKKDRYVNLPRTLIPLLQDYLKVYQPVDYLFEGQFANQYTTRSAQAVFKNAMEKAKITKSVGIHGLRHSYATHLLEAGTDMVFIQKLLGHSAIKTTEMYAKVSNRLISKVESPLDSIV